MIRRHVSAPAIQSAAVLPKARMWPRLIAQPPHWLKHSPPRCRSELARRQSVYRNIEKSKSSRATPLRAEPNLLIPPCPVHSVARKLCRSRLSPTLFRFCLSLLFRLISITALLAGGGGPRAHVRTLSYRIIGAHYYDVAVLQSGSDVHLRT